MRKRIFSAALVLCLFISSQSSAYAWQEESLWKEDNYTEASTSKLTARDAEIPTPTEVYEAMIALKEQEEYKEGTVWTNDTPYSGTGYRWHGGTIDGANISAVGCVAFAFILSDAAFGSLPNRMYGAGEFKFEDIKAGDILRVSNDAHTVIVLEVSDAGVVVAEGNISTGDHQGKVHWGRAISKEEVMSNTSHYITRYPEGYFPPDDPTANDPMGDDSQGSVGGLNWKLTKAGTLTVSGSGAMPDFSSADEQPWSKYSGRIRKVVMEDGVTSIGSCAFFNCGVLSAEIPSSVTTIGSNAFYGSSIISAAIPSSVKSIGDSAFRECQNLSSVTISEGVETIGENAFRACKSLTAITLPASIETVGAAAFFQCQAMTRASFVPGSKKVTLGDNLFTQCYYLVSVTLPQSIDRISEGMFQNCLMLAEVEIPQGAESIGGSAFASSGLTTLVIPDSVTSIGIAAFSDCPLKDIYFTGTEEQWTSVQKIGDTASAVLQATVHCDYVHANISEASVTLSQLSYRYDGTAKTPSVTVKLGDATLVLDTDYTVSYSKNKEVGTADVTVTGKGKYTGSKTVNFTIIPAEEDEEKTDISAARVTLEKTIYTYDGTAKTPSVTVELNGKTLVMNTDYTVSYSDNIKVGTAKVTITGKGSYIGSRTVSFTIAEAAAQSPKVSITCNKTVYEVAYGTKPFKINASSNGRMAFTSSKPKIAAVNKDTGLVTIKNTGISVITIKAGEASKKVTVKVSPKKQTVKSAKTVKGKKLTVKWAKDKMASGYQVQISTDKKFKKSVKSKNLTKTSFTFTKLKTGKKYYVRLRSYKKSGKETLYGTWSKVKLSSKIKK